VVVTPEDDVAKIVDWSSPDNFINSLEVAARAKAYGDGGGEAGDEEEPDTIGGTIMPPKGRKTSSIKNISNPDTLIDLGVSGGKGFKLPGKDNQ
jgi:hypothetical protein